MGQYINKDILVAEIEKRLKHNGTRAELDRSSSMAGRENEDKDILSFLDTLEVKEVDTWHLQEKENIYDAVKDWNLHTFACVMKDGTIQKFTGNMDEDYEGHINVYICGTNDDYDDVDDIVKWIEFT